MVAIGAIGSYDRVKEAEQVQDQADSELDQAKLEVQQAEQFMRETMTELKASYDECVAAGGKATCDAMNAENVRNNPDLEPWYREYGIPVS